jgi:outer membrane protein assembly factor BamD
MMTMTASAPLWRLVRLAAALCVLGALAGACVRPMRMPAPGEREPDKYLFDRGSEALTDRRWIEAREYYQRLVDQYPQSPYRQEARLGIGDSYLGEGGYDGLIIAAEKFREFLRFFPLNDRADYAQYRIAVAESRQMLSPDRDQTSTVNTLREVEAFLQRFPTSPYMPDVLTIQREARTRLSDSEFRVAQYYFRNSWYPGVVPRLERLVADDPGYPRRDAVYYHLGETYYRTGRAKQALPYFEKLVEEFQVSEYLEQARTRITELTR